MTEPVEFPRRVAIIGLGLLGGSVAMSIRRFDPSVHLVAAARKESTRQYALQQQIVDQAVADPTEAAAGCDLAVVATPVDSIATLVIDLAEKHPDVTLTDVGSTKRRIVEQVMRHSAATQFLAAHPIAGSERTGVQHASADLFDDRPIVLTPSGRESAHHRRRAEAFWAATGGRTVVMPADQHDAHLAVTSHVPHLLSALIARSVSPEAMPLVGTGWRDTTRIAAGDPALWTAIVSENRTAIEASLRSVQADLAGLLSRIEAADDAQLRSWLTEAQQIRTSVPSDG